MQRIRDSPEKETREFWRGREGYIPETENWDRAKAKVETGEEGDGSRKWKENSPGEGG